MTDPERTKEELLEEASSLRRRVAELERLVAGTAQIEDSLTRFSIDHVADAGFWMGADSRFIYVNQAASRTLRYSIDELLTMGVTDIDPLFPADHFPEHWEELRSKGTLTFESQHRRKDGSLFPVEITANYVEIDGKGYNCAFARDITERKQAEANRSALEARMRMVQKHESLGVMAGGIAHKFNNVLQTILGSAEFLAASLPEDSETLNDVELIKSSARRAAELTKQMLEYTGTGVRDSAPLGICSLIRGMGTLIGTALPADVRISYKLSEGDCPIVGDALQLEQALMALLLNAAEASPDDGIEIVVRTGIHKADEAFLATLPLGGGLDPGFYAFVDVADNGCGMDEATRLRIFDPFFSTKFIGRGLGLASVLGIVRGHGGAISVTSTPGQGSTFRILLPLAKPGQAPQRVAETPDQAPPPARERPKTGGATILVADDEAPVLLVMGRMLEAAGFTVVTASDGKEAVDTVKRAGKTLDLVLLDLSMPVMGGMLARREISVLEPDLRVAFSSGYSEEDFRMRHPEEADTGFIHKPFTRNELLQKVMAELRR